MKSSAITNLTSPHISNQLKDWFLAIQRPLPWRKDYQPYHVWISEVMLQQTRVEAVLPYFNRWIAALPTIQDVASAEEDTILKLWEGLGYYSRARNLHKAAKQLVELGGIPADYNQLLTLSGIGPYTAAAISSIAFDLPHPVLDGNVERVFSRLLDWAEPIKTKGSTTRFQELGHQLIAGQSPRILNQAFMELGALVCLPKAPRCVECPIHGHCQSLQAGTQATRPVKLKKTKVIKEKRFFLVLEHEGKYFLQKQEKGQLWAGLYAFPHFLQEEQSIAEVTAGYDLKAGAENLGSFKYSVTKYQVTAEAFLIPLQTLPAQLEGEWFTYEGLEPLTLPKSGVWIRGQLG